MSLFTPRHTAVLFLLFAIFAVTFAVACGGGGGDGANLRDDDGDGGGGGGDDDDDTPFPLDDDSTDDDSTDDDSTDDDSTDDDSTDDDSTDDDATDDDSTDDDSTDDDSTDDDSTDDDSAADDDDDFTPPPVEGAPYFEGVRTTYGGHDSSYFIQVEWLEAEDAQGDDVTYNIYEATDPGSFSFDSPTYTTTALEYRVDGLTAETMLCYTVRAQDEEDNEDENFMASCAVAADVIYVDPVNGDDGGAGTAGDPYASFDPVQSDLDGTVTTNVYVAEGTLESPLTLVSDTVGVYGSWTVEAADGKATWTRDLDAFTTALDVTGGNTFETANSFGMFDGFAVQGSVDPPFNLTTGTYFVLNCAVTGGNAGVLVNGAGGDQVTALIAGSTFSGAPRGVWAQARLTSEVNLFALYNHFTDLEEGYYFDHGSAGAGFALAYGNTIDNCETGISILGKKGNLLVQAFANNIEGMTYDGIKLATESMQGVMEAQLISNTITHSGGAGIALDLENPAESINATCDRNRLIANEIGIAMTATQSPAKGDKLPAGGYTLTNNRVYGGQAGIVFELTNDGVGDLEFGPLIANNAVFGAVERGISIEVENLAGSLLPAEHIYNNDVFNCAGSGVYIDHPLTTMTGSDPRFENNIVLGNDEDLTVVFGMPADRIAYNDYGSGTFGSGPGNITALPHVKNVPNGVDMTTAVGTRSTFQVANVAGYTVGDTIELADDGEARTISSVAGNIVTFSPQADVAVPAGEVVFLWEDATNVDENLYLAPGSPCIDTGNPAGALNDTDGSRNDMGATGGPLANQN